MDTEIPDTHFKRKHVTTKNISYFLALDFKHIKVAI